MLIPVLAAAGGLSGVAALVRMVFFDPAAVRASERQERRQMQDDINDLHSQIQDHRRRETDLLRRLSDMERDRDHWKRVASGRQ